MLPQGGGGIAPQPTREPLPEIEKNAQKLIDQLPQKDISVSIDSLRQFIGLAKGGEVRACLSKLRQGYRSIIRFRCLQYKT